MGANVSVSKQEVEKFTKNEILNKCESKMVTTSDLSNLNVRSKNCNIRIGNKTRQKVTCNFDTVMDQVSDMVQNLSTTQAAAAGMAGNLSKSDSATRESTVNRIKNECKDSAVAQNTMDKLNVDVDCTQMGNGGMVDILNEVDVHTECVIKSMLASVQSTEVIQENDQEVAALADSLLGAGGGSKLIIILCVVGFVALQVIIK